MIFTSEVQNTTDVIPILRDHHQMMVVTAEGMAIMVVLTNHVHQDRVQILQAPFRELEVRAQLVPVPIIINEELVAVTMVLEDTEDLEVRLMIRGRLAAIQMEMILKVDVIPSWMRTKLNHMSTHLHTMEI
jgi:hypothetical protein